LQRQSRFRGSGPSQSIPRRSAKASAPKRRGDEIVVMNFLNSSVLIEFVFCNRSTENGLSDKKNGTKPLLQADESETRMIFSFRGKLFSVVPPSLL
jgi:hypothetical protein